MMISNSKLHHTILRFVIDNGYGPNVEELSKLLETTTGEVEESLNALQDYHGVVLHPKQPKVWAIHPFSLAPTNFIVKTKTGGKRWWGCCAWCSFGIAAILKEDVVITTSFGAHGEKADIAITDGEVEDEQLLVHFPVPMKDAWVNVIYTCSTMLVFQQERHIDEWCQKHRIGKGDVQPLPLVWRFAQDWYGNHLDENWIKWTKKEAKDLFCKHGLKHKVWDLESGSSRF